MLSACDDIQVAAVKEGSSPDDDWVWMDDILGGMSAHAEHNCLDNEMESVTSR